MDDTHASPSCDQCPTLGVELSARQANIAFARWKVVTFIMRAAKRAGGTKKAINAFLARQAKGTLPPEVAAAALLSYRQQRQRRSLSASTLHRWVRAAQDGGVRALAPRQ